MIWHPSFHKIVPKIVHNNQARVTMYISNTNPYLTYQPRTDYIDNRDIQCIEIYTLSIEWIHLFNLYNQKIEGGENNLRLGEKAVVRIKLPARTIVTGDMNAHHTWWNSKNRRHWNSDKIMEIVEKADFDFITTSDIPTCTPKRRRHINHRPDLVHPKYNQWNTPLGYKGRTTFRVRLKSNHLRDTLDQLERVPEPTTQKYNWKKVIRKKFQQYFSQIAEQTKEWWDKIINYNSEENMEKAARILTKDIKEAPDLHAPPHNISPGPSTGGPRK